MESPNFSLQANSLVYSSGTKSNLEVVLRNERAYSLEKIGGQLVINFHQDVNDINGIPIQDAIMVSRVLVKQEGVPLEEKKMPPSGFIYEYGHHKDDKCAGARYDRYEKEYRRRNGGVNEASTYKHVNKKVRRSKRKIMVYGPGDFVKEMQFLMEVFDIQNLEELNQLREVYEYEKLLKAVGSKEFTRLLKSDAFEKVLTRVKDDFDKGCNTKIISPDMTIHELNLYNRLCKKCSESGIDLNRIASTSTEHFLRLRNLSSRESHKLGIFRLEINLIDVSPALLQISEDYIKKHLGITPMKIAGDFMDPQNRSLHVSNFDVGHVINGGTVNNLEPDEFLSRMVSQLRPWSDGDRHDMFFTVGQEMDEVALDEHYASFPEHDEFVVGGIAGLLGYEFEQYFEAVHDSHGASKGENGYKEHGSRGMGGFTMNERAIAEFPNGIKVTYFNQQTQKEETFTYKPGERYYVIYSWRHGDKISDRIAVHAGYKNSGTNHMNIINETNASAYEIMLKPQITTVVPTIATVKRLYPHLRSRIVNMQVHMLYVLLACFFYFLIEAYESGKFQEQEKTRMEKEISKLEDELASMNSAYENTFVLHYKSVISSLHALGLDPDLITNVEAFDDENGVLRYEKFMLFKESIMWRFAKYYRFHSEDREGNLVNSMPRSTVNDLISMFLNEAVGGNEVAADMIDEVLNNIEDGTASEKEFRFFEKIVESNSVLLESKGIVLVRTADTAYW